jgi:polar amino acid transport system substrate-binding protein
VCVRDGTLEQRLLHRWQLQRDGERAGDRGVGRPVIVPEEMPRRHLDGDREGGAGATDASSRQAGQPRANETLRGGQALRARVRPCEDARMSSEAAVRELAPTGTLRVGVAVGPAASPGWTIADPVTGDPSGVAVDLGRALASRIGTPLQIVRYASSGEVTEALAREAIDVAFMPVDEDRKQVVAFGPNYALGTSTYLVPDGSPITSIEEVDREGIRVGGVESTTTIRAARRSLSAAEVTGTTGADELLALLRAGEVDAVALGRDSLQQLAGLVPGSRILDGHFLSAGTAIAVPKGRPAALELASTFIENAKADGVVQAAFDRAGLTGASVAPPGWVS